MIRMHLYKILAGWFTYRYGRLAIKRGDQHMAAHADAMLRAGTCQSGSEVRDSQGRRVHENKLN